MAEIVLFHHAQGLTPGVIAFADELCRFRYTAWMPIRSSWVRGTLMLPGRSSPKPRRRTLSLPRDQHYFADNSLPSYDAAATALLLQRMLAFLGALS